MPRVVANQRERFENDELFRKLSRDVEVSNLAYDCTYGLELVILEHRPLEAI
jgi:hypothetical protein